MVPWFILKPSELKWAFRYGIIQIRQVWYLEFKKTKKNIKNFMMVLTFLVLKLFFMTFSFRSFVITMPTSLGWIPFITTWISLQLSFVYVPFNKRRVRISFFSTFPPWCTIDWRRLGFFYGVFLDDHQEGKPVVTGIIWVFEDLRDAAFFCCFPPDFSAS